MLIQEVMEKAREGGYTPYHCNARSYAVLEHYFLDTSFWESLGRTMGWEGDFEYINMRGDEPRKVRQPMWLYYWHRFNSHLVAGNTPESFFATLSDPPEAAR